MFAQWRVQKVLLNNISFIRRLHIYLSEKTPSHFSSCHSSRRGKKTSFCSNCYSTKINLRHQSSWIKPFILGFHKHFISRKEQLHSWAPSGAFVLRKFWQRPNQTRRQRRAAVKSRIKQVSIFNVSFRSKRWLGPSCIWPLTFSGRRPTKGTNWRGGSHEVSGMGAHVRCWWTSCQMNTNPLTWSMCGEWMLGQSGQTLRLRVDKARPHHYTSDAKGDLCWSEGSRPPAENVCQTA